MNTTEEHPEGRSSFARKEAVQGLARWDMVKTKTGKLWSADVTKHSNALDLERGVFTWSDPRRIARSLKESAESSSTRKSSPKQSAMSMLNFYINRAGKNLGMRQKRVLEEAKEELRHLFEAS